jgi:hypothetical protein
MSKTCSLYYTAALLKSGKARLNVMLAIIDADNKVTNKMNIKKTVTCSAGDEDHYRAFVERNKDSLFRSLLAIAKRIEPELLAKTGQSTNSVEPPTFGAFYIAYWPQIVKLFGWQNSTSQQYYSTIKNQLSPLLDHKYMCDLSLKDYEDAVNALIQMRTEDNKEYSKSRLDKFWSNLCAVTEYACILGFCASNPLKEHSHKIDPLAKAKRESFHRKSLTAVETLKVVQHLALNLLSDPRIIGSCIQLVGLRPAECGGLSFCDVIYFKQQPDRCYLAVHTQYTQGNAEKGNNHILELKTSNGYRYVPVPMEIQVLIEYLREQLLGLGFTPEEIASMPIVVKPQDKNVDYYKRCGPRDISACGKHALSETVGKRYVFEIPSISSNEGGQESMLPLESDSQAYELRRIFATRCYGVCGLSLEQLEYVMGHTILDSQLNGRAFEFANEDWLIDIMHKMDRAILVTDRFGGNELLARMARTDLRKLIETVKIEADTPVEFEVKDEISKNLLICPSSENVRVRVRLNFQAIEPDDAIDIRIRSGGMAGIVVPVVARNIGLAPLKTTNIQSIYLDELFGDTLEETSDEEQDDGDEVDDKADIEAYERAWENHVENDPPSEDEESAE